MKALLNKSLLVAAGLMVSLSAFAVPVVDGALGAGEYGSSFTAGWYNGHEQGGSQYPDGGGQTTTLYQSLQALL